VSYLIIGLSKLEGPLLIVAADFSVVSASAVPQANEPKNDKARHRGTKGFLLVLKVLTVNIEAYP
jgi:hypothetical protein